MNSNKTACLLEVASKIDLSDFKTNKTNANKALVATFAKNIEGLGFTFSKTLINKLSNLNKADLGTLSKEVTSILQKMVGANVKHKPMYPNFPEQVMNADEVELYLNALLHYLGLPAGENILSPENKTKRSPLIGNYKLKVIDLASADEYRNVINNLVNSNIALSEQQKGHVKAFYEANKATFHAPLIKNKEISAFLAGLFYADGRVNELAVMLRTPTDVLRFITALSGGDISLAENTKFKKMKRSERRILLDLLNRMKGLQENMVKYKTKWLRVGEILHPGDYASKFKKIFSAFRDLRQDADIETFNSTVEALLLKGEFDKAAKVLSERPTELVRRLDHLLRNSAKTTVIMNLFKKAVKDVPTNVLLNVRSHFMGRHQLQDTRIFFPKGSLAKVQVMDMNLSVLDKALCEKIATIVEESLVERFSSLKKMGKVYVDEALKTVNIPFALRSASFSFKTVARGSRVAIPGDKKIVRLFTYWRNGLKPGATNTGHWGEDRIDIDLSAMFLNEKFEESGHVSWTNLRYGGGNDNVSAHSGDIVDAPNGASEFIDINIEKALKMGARYVAVNIITYTGQNFSDMKECFAGVMLRDNLKSGEAYEAKSVEHKFDLTSASQTAMPMLFDLKTREMIWLDMVLPKRNAYWGRTIEGNARSISRVVQGIVEMNKPTLYDLFTLHAKGRGKLVKSKKDADKVYDLNYALDSVPEILTLI